MTEIKTRCVEVDGIVYDVPTNVYWKVSRRCWQVSVRLDKKNVVDNFHPSQFEDSIKAAFDAACKFAVLKRKYPSKERHSNGLRLSKRSLDGRPALPLGVGYRQVRKNKRDKTLGMVYVLEVFHESRTFRSIRIGPVEGYTDEQYARALRIAISTLKKIKAQREKELKQQERFRQEYMTHASAPNPFSQLTYSIEKYHRSRRPLQEAA